MALSNSEKQARFRQRKQERLNECVTPADIDRAVQMVYEGRRHDEPENPPFAEWLANLERLPIRKAGELWRGLMPDSGDPGQYHDHLSDDDRHFLAKVGAVIAASQFPAKYRKRGLPG